MFKLGFGLNFSSVRRSRSFFERFPQYANSTFVIDDFNNGFVSREAVPLVYPDASFVIDRPARLRSALPFDSQITRSTLQDFVTINGGTVARNTARWNFDSTGTLIQVPANTVAQDFNPVTLAYRGIPIEPARTNQIRNTAFSGGSNGVVGSGGSFPTNMAWQPSSSNMSVERIGTGTEFGMPFIDLRIFGTHSGSTVAVVEFEQNNVVAASSGQTWTSSLYFRRIANPGASLNPSVGLSRHNNGTYSGKYVSSAPTFDNVLRRHSITVTLDTSTPNDRNVVTAFTHIRPRVEFLSVAAGTVVDFTVRLYVPQLELGAYTTSPILTTGSAVTRAADSIRFPLNTGWFRHNAGTVVIEFTPYALEMDRNIVSIVNSDTLFTTGSIRFRTAPSNGEFTGYRVVDNLGNVSFNGNIGSTPLAAGVIRRSAFVFAPNDFVACTNGVVSAASTSGQLPTMPEMRIGVANSQASGQPPGFHLRRLVFYPSRLPDATLQSLTT